VGLELTKQCKRCFIEKPLSLFSKDSKAKNKKRSYCKQCDRSRTDSWKENNKERIAEYNSSYKLQYNYGLSTEDYEKLLNKQNSKCAICNIDQKDLKRKLVVDHCHSSNKVRGLLCSHCNVGIGMLKENQDNLVAAIQYLKDNS
jgi:hypothetical protein